MDKLNPENLVVVTFDVGGDDSVNAMSADACTGCPSGCGIDGQAAAFDA